MDQTKTPAFRRAPIGVYVGGSPRRKQRNLLRSPVYGGAALSAILAIVCAAHLSTSAQAGRWRPEVENPYCSITTYQLRDVAEQASSMTDRQGRPVIVINSSLLRDNPNYGKFLMAHECCHHTLGHVAKFKKDLGHVGPQAFFYIAPELKRLELEADCCAARLLRDSHEPEGIDAGATAMSAFGEKPTGAYYPTGLERVEMMRRCGALDP